MNCLQCNMYDRGSCRAWALAIDELKRTLPPAPLGSCMLPIVERYLAFMKPGMRILDIGCGSWSRIRRHCQEIGAAYDGIDVAETYFGVPTVATRLENLADLSFPDESFDVVVSNQSMEHWGEFGCSLRWGLYQCFRVCKLGGRIFLNVPIHFHGTKEFMLGQYGRLMNELLHFTEDARLEKWGHPSGEMPPVYPFPGYWRLAGSPAHILDMQLVKTRPTPLERRPRLQPSGRIAQLLRYPFSFNVYRVLHKAKVLP